YVSLAVVTPIASTLGDRYPRRLVMISSDTLRAALVLAAAAVIETDGPSTAVYTLAIVTAVCGSPFRSSQASILPQLARDPIELAAANVASSTVESIGFFAGPALAGLLLAVASIPVVYVFNALTFVWSAGLVLGLRVPPREGEQPAAGRADRGSLFSAASAGIPAILDDRNPRALVCLYGL